LEFAKKQRLTKAAANHVKKAGVEGVKFLRELLLRPGDDDLKMGDRVLVDQFKPADKVDVIGVPPVVETGWETVFKEAKDAGIPIILVDRRAAVPEDMYATYIGSDFVEEGRNAARTMAKIVNNKANIVELVGTVGSAPANDRAKGFREIIKDIPDMKIIDSQSGDFTRAGGKQVMEAFLKKEAKDITAVYAHNDDMAIGAIQAIEEAGLKPGTDIKIVSVDAVRGAFEAMVAGKLNATVECNPLLGPQFYEMALKAVNGETLPKWVPSKEGIYLPDTPRKSCRPASTSF